SRVTSLRECAGSHPQLPAPREAAPGDLQPAELSVGLGRNRAQPHRLPAGNDGDDRVAPHDQRRLPKRPPRTTIDATDPRPSTSRRSNTPSRPRGVSIRNPSQLEPVI